MLEDINPPAGCYNETQIVYIIDDDNFILNYLSDFLIEKKIHFKTFDDGFEMLKAMEEAPCTIAVTDLMMPKIDGINLISEIKERWSETDIIVMTGYYKNVSYTNVINIGASDFIQKPFQLDEFEAKLMRIIRERIYKNLLKCLIIYDPLTGLYNRRCFDEQIVRESTRSFRQNQELHLMSIDMDKLKELNDTKGHAAGDEALKLLGMVIKNSTREHVDSAYRLGGDEFIVILPISNTKLAQMIAERIRSNYYSHTNGETTLSIGVIKFLKSSEINSKIIEEMIKKADATMYAAKKLGGNAVVVDVSNNLNKEQQ